MYAIKSILLLLLLTSPLFAQQVILNNSKQPNGVFTNTAPASLRQLDLGDHNSKMLWLSFPNRKIGSYGAYPVLMDVEFNEMVTITGTLEQAQADLNRAVSNQFPATVRERGRDVKADARQAAINAANANSVPALRAEVKRLAELIEQLQERVERAGQ